MNSETYKEPSETPSGTTLGKSKTLSQKTTPEKDSTGRQTVTIQSRRQWIFNNKVQA